jgi:hypothetical protein
MIEGKNSLAISRSFGKSGHEFISAYTVMQHPTPRQNKPHHPTASSRSVSMIFRDYNLNRVLDFRPSY